MQSSILSRKLDPSVDRLGGHTAPYLNGFSAEGLRAYGLSFSGTSPKYTQNSPFLLPYLVPYLTSIYY